MKQMMVFVDATYDEVNEWIRAQKRKDVLSIKRMHNPISNVMETIIIYDEAGL